METKKQIGNVTEYYLNNKLALTITKCDNNYYIVENTVSRLEGICMPLDEYYTKVYLIKNYTKGKNGRLYKTKKLYNHNSSWFSYILEKEGFVRKSKCMN
jgi:hypothetical protein